jgi:hypothetical protein
MKSSNMKSCRMQASHPSAQRLMEPNAADRKPVALGFRQILACLPQTSGRGHLRARTIMA